MCVSEGERESSSCGALLSHKILSACSSDAAPAAAVPDFSAADGLPVRENDRMRGFGECMPLLYIAAVVADSSSSSNDADGRRMMRANITCESCAGMHVLIITHARHTSWHTLTTFPADRADRGKRDVRSAPAKDLCRRQMNTNIIMSLPVSPAATTTPLTAAVSTSVDGGG